MSRKEHLILAIDPSIRDMGWAIFSIDVQRETAELVKSGFLKYSEKKSRGHEWINRVDESVCDVYEECMRVEESEDLLAEGLDSFCAVVIEMPEPHGGARGEAAKNTGATLKLMAQAFSIRQMMIEHAKHIGTGQAVMITPRIWKGQVDKSVTKRRNERHWGWSGSNLNESDAVGIGSWYIRKILNYKATR